MQTSVGSTDRTRSEFQETRCRSFLRAQVQMYVERLGKWNLFVEPVDFEVVLEAGWTRKGATRVTR